MMFLQAWRGFLTWRGFLNWRGDSTLWLVKHSSLDRLDQPRRGLRSLVLHSLDECGGALLQWHSCKSACPREQHHGPQQQYRGPQQPARIWFVCA